jgi:hypothetical protein
MGDAYPRGGARPRRDLENTPEAVEQFFLDRAVRFPEQRVAVALEQSRGALLCFDAWNGLGRRLRLDAESSVRSMRPQHSSIF